ncbi:MAG TPA: M1 family metallopeptidase [Pyrinomonadaceae bacterium]|nr:M1 family metallopeptidase [Pyrinomonadaceae bacterium]
MMNKILVTLFVLFIWVNLNAQDLYMPRNVRAAYTKETRSPDGKPGKNYWQNTGDYKISITINPETGLVNGTEEIVYKNNSPNPIESPVIRLTMNIHRKGIAREQSASDDYLTDGVTIDEFKENDQVREWKDSGQTFQPIRLQKKIGTGESTKLSFKWHYTLSKESNREGMVYKNSYFLAYFYPRVAVYDDIDGWDRVPFLEGHEFYNDFNNYNLEVTTPKNFIVWATGDLQNIDEVLQPKFAAKLKESFTSDNVINIASLADLNSNSVTAQKDMLTWKWKANNITDVAVAVSNTYIWDAGSVVVDKKTNRRASVQAAYNTEAKDYQKMVEYGKHSLDWCSNNYPGVPYPFSKTTIVRGFADMEYPMMVNDSSFDDPTFARFVVEHEILHTWFPFYMGINEQRYGFMDEGWTTAFENLIAKADMGEERANLMFKQFRVISWAKSPSGSSDLPIIIPGDELSGRSLGNNEYGKAAVAYLALKDLLGDELFKKSLHEFMNRWNGKHPLPWDMFNSFNNASGKNLNWFFQNWYFSYNYIDVALKNAILKGKNYSLTINNIGGFAIPLDVVVKYDDGTTDKFHQTPGIWSKNQKQATVLITAKKKVKSITLDGGIYMDADETNNIWEQK